MKKQRISVTGPVFGSICPPGSKSLTNRALLVAALTAGESVLHGVLDSEDSQIMVDALILLGIPIDWNKETATLTITGYGGNFPVKQGDIYVGNSGTSARFLTAALARSDGQYRICGKPRMHERPIADLIETIDRLGGNVLSENQNGCPPLLIKGTKEIGGHGAVAANVSSQFLSALLMMGVGVTKPLSLEVRGTLVSRPYIEMTLALMRSFGANIETDSSLQHFTGFEKTAYRPTRYAIEPDASAASYFFAIPAIVGGKMTVERLTRRSLQGDIGFVDCLEKLGCIVQEGEDCISVERPLDSTGKPIPLHGCDFNMNAISDTVQTLAVVALFAEGTTHIHNVAHIRHKETDRIKAVVCELQRLGATVTESESGLTIQGLGAGAADHLHGTSIKTYDDHRMAMSFALVGLVIPEIEIEDPHCTAKTYPKFFDDLDRVIGKS